MGYFNDDFQWVGNSTNFSSKEECEIILGSPSHCFKCYIRDDAIYKTFEKVIEFFVIIIAGFGLLGNFMSIYILTKKDFSSRFSNLLIMLAYADIRLPEEKLNCNTMQACCLAISVWRRSADISGVLTSTTPNKTWWTCTTTWVPACSILCTRSSSWSRSSSQWSSGTYLYYVDYHCKP